MLSQMVLSLGGLNIVLQVKNKAVINWSLPEISLAYARDARDKARKLLIEKIDPALTRRLNGRQN